MGGENGGEHLDGLVQKLLQDIRLLIAPRQCGADRMEVSGDVGGAVYVGGGEFFDRVCPGGVAADKAAAERVHPLRVDPPVKRDQQAGSIAEVIVGNRL